jgi:hypothetical protein
MLELLDFRFRKNMKRLTRRIRVGTNRRPQPSRSINISVEVSKFSELQTSLIADTEKREYKLAIAMAQKHKGGCTLTRYHKTNLRDHVCVL